LAQLLTIAQGFGDLMGAFNEKFRERAWSSILERDDPDLPVRPWQFDRQLGDGRMPRGKSKDSGRNDRKKTAGRRQTNPHIDRGGVDRGARRFESTGMEGFDHE
jgi:hypothetical protein